MKKANEFFNETSIPLVNASPGVNLDFIQHMVMVTDPDIVIDQMINGLAEDSPVKVFESKILIDGTDQELIVQAPRGDDLAIAGKTRLYGVELAIQLNRLTIPKTDITLFIDYLNSFGEVLPSMSQKVTGTASDDGGTRQFITFLPFETNTVMESDQSTFKQDGKTFAPRNFVDHDNEAVLFFIGLGFTLDQARGLLDGAAKDIAAVRLSFPDGKWTIGVEATVSPITTGRYEQMMGIVQSFEAVRSRAAAEVMDSQVQNASLITKAANNIARAITGTMDDDNAA